jgi:hypothetical protein
VLFPLENFPAFSKKLMDGTSETVHDIVSMLGLVMLPFAVVSAFYRFKTPTGNAVRGLLYGVAPVLCLSIALFSLGSSAIILVAPAVAVFGCAYFFLLLDAKKLHPVYWRGILIGAILLVSWPALVAITWDRNDRENQMSDVTRLMVNGDALGITCMYTDVPWISAWRTLRVVAVWIPRSDDDISKLGIEGLPMNAVILTAESRKLDPDETWYRLATMELQRDFVANPDEVLERVRDYGNELGRSPEEVKTMKSFFRQDQRNANVYDSLIGFRQADLGPFASDDLRVFERKSE